MSDKSIKSKRGFWSLYCIAAELREIPALNQDLFNEYLQSITELLTRSEKARKLWRERGIKMN